MKHLNPFILFFILTAYFVNVKSQDQEYVNAYETLKADGRFTAFVYFAEQLAYNDVHLQAGLQYSEVDLTVFPFTDDAWYTSFPLSCTLDILGPERVAFIVAHHIFAGAAVVYEYVTDGAEVPMMSGDGAALIRVNENGWKFIDDAMIVIADMIAQNDAGYYTVLHALNRVIIPPSLDLPPECRTAPNVMALASSHPDDAFSSFVEGVGSTGLMPTLQSPGPFTIFLPTNQAFDDLPEGVYECLKRPENKDVFVDLLLYHIYDLSFYPVMSWYMSDGQEPTMANQDIAVLRIIDDTGYLNDARFLWLDQIARNGVIHVIDKVLIPPDFAVPNSCAQSEPATTIAPTNEPTRPPTNEPTRPPTNEPTTPPTNEPTRPPTNEPTVPPTNDPTAPPTASPTKNPTASPTNEPSAQPTREPTSAPTKEPTAVPTSPPTNEPTAESPEDVTGIVVSTLDPTPAPVDPTFAPVDPTPAPVDPTFTPVDPTPTPTPAPTDAAVAPTKRPTETPLSKEPTERPTTEPKTAPTKKPTAMPTSKEPTEEVTPTTEPAPTLFGHSLFSSGYRLPQSHIPRYTLPPSPRYSLPPFYDTSITRPSHFTSATEHYSPRYEGVKDLLHSFGSWRRRN